MAATEHLVLHEAVVRRGGVPDHHLLALDDHDAVDDARVVGGPAAAPAQRLHLEHLHPVGQLDEAAGTREQLGAEVRGDAERGDVDAHLVDHPRELLDLPGRVELRLVADEVVDPAPRGQAAGDGVPEVEVVVDLDRVGRQAQP